MTSGEGGIEEPNFAPEDPADGRGIGHWTTRYPEKAAKKGITFEAALVLGYLLLAVTGVSALVVAAAISPPDDPLVMSLKPLLPFALAFGGGMLGGTLFSMKWLYHSVARGRWNRDRRLWRVFAPLLSAGSALTVILLCASGVVPLFGPALVRDPAGALGLSVVFGYFSDRTFSALERWFTESLGAPRGHRP